MSMLLPGRRLWSVTTPLGQDAFLLVAFTGREALSELFSFRLELVAPNGLTVPFDRVLGRGVSVTLHLADGTPHYDGDGDYVLTSVEHTGKQPSQEASHGLDAYTNRFTALPAATPYRPPRTTPKPTIHGTQTATVVGPKGEEIFTDKYGRVKVQFPWDRQGKKDGTSSCWLRVSQVHAGKRWGGIDIPRVGEEVVVAFEEGDPDRPIVIGRVYNAENMPPFPLPAGRMKGGLKSNTYPGGGDNEISMDDTKGKDRVRRHPLPLPAFRTQACPPPARFSTMRRQSSARSETFPTASSALLSEGWGTSTERSGTSSGSMALSRNWDSATTDSNSATTPRCSWRGAP